MRCVRLIVYLESSTSFIDLVPDRPLRSPSPNVILLCGIVCQMITGRCHSHFPRGLALMIFVMPWENCCCLGYLSILYVAFKTSIQRLLIPLLLLSSVNYHCELTGTPDITGESRNVVVQHDIRRSWYSTPKQAISLWITPSLDPNVGNAFTHKTHKHRSQ